MAPHKDVTKLAVENVNSLTSDDLNARIVESRVVLSDLPGQETRMIPAKHADIDVSIQLDNGVKKNLRIGKWINQNKETFIRTDKISEMQSDYSLRYRPSKEKQITLKELLDCAREQKPMSEENCQHASINLFNKSTGLNETDIPQQYYYDLFQAIKVKTKQTVDNRGVQVTLEVTQKTIRAVCQLPQTRAVAGNTIKAFLVTCYKNKANENMTVEEIIGQAYNQAKNTMKTSSVNTIISTAVSKSGKAIYQTLDQS